MFGLGVGELLLILVVALLVFGPTKLPELARTMGKAMAEFRKASRDLRETFEVELHRMDAQQQQPPQQQQQQVSVPLPRTSEPKAPATAPAPSVIDAEVEEAPPPPRGPQIRPPEQPGLALPKPGTEAPPEANV